MINPNPRQQCCPKCYWKNPMIQSSDIRIGQYDNCPRCGSKLNYKNLKIYHIKNRSIYQCCFSCGWRKTLLMASTVLNDKTNTCPICKNNLILSELPFWERFNFLSKIFK